jgi:hypothetical protein
VFNLVGNTVGRCVILCAMGDDAQLKMSKEEFQAKLDMTKAFNETAKSYVQISSAGLALPLLFRQAMLGKTAAENGVAPSSWILIGAWSLFLLSIGFGITYQWLSIRRLWDQFHEANRTLQNAMEPGFRTSRWIPKINGLNLSAIWMGMTACLWAGALLFTIYAYQVIPRK